MKKDDIKNLEKIAKSTGNEDLKKAIEKKVTILKNNKEVKK